MLEYAKHLNANEEVIGWCNTVLEARRRKHQEVDQTECEHILDYLVSDAAPKRLRKMSYSQAKAGADKWTKAQQKKGAHLVDGPEDLETIHEFGDSCKIVKLLTKAAAQREGYFMAHCVGSYDPEVTTLYSYRDKNNTPHATFEVDTSDGYIQQVKGKGNGPIHPKYIEPILAFLKSIGMEVRSSEMQNLGYYSVNKETEALLSKFVDTKGRGPAYHTLYGVKYVYSV